MEAIADLRARLDRACAQGVAANIGRWHGFAAARPGDAFEIAALKVPGRGSFKSTWITRCSSTQATIAAIDAVARHTDLKRAPAFYTLVNVPHPTITAQEGGADRWFQAGKGEDGRASDKQIVARAAIYIDVDPVRPANLSISATAVERAAAWSRALDVIARLEPVVGVDAIGVGDSGNGTAVYVALDRLPESKELHAAITTTLRALDALHSDDVVKIDTTVSNAARLHSFYGTMKRKGDNQPDRPHRPTGFLALLDRVPRRLGLDEVLELAAKLQELAPATAPEKPRTTAAPRPASSTGAREETPATSDASPFALANDIPVGDVARELGLFDGDALRCPRGCSGGTSVAILESKNLLKCSHQTCADVGPRGGGVRTAVDLWAEVRGVKAITAARQLCKWRGIALHERERKKHEAKPAPAASTSEWWSLLNLTPKGAVQATSSNAVTMLRHDERWAGVFEYEERRDQVRIAKTPPFPEDLAVDGDTFPRQVRDPDFLRISVDLARTHGVVFSEAAIASAVTSIAARNARDPVREYLEALVWDGTGRLDYWLAALLDVPYDREEPDAPAQRYVREVGAKWMISAVARTYVAGCKADHVLVLEGAQGIGKSSALAALVPEPLWFSDELRDFHNKDSADSLRGPWIVEIAELDAMQRSELTAMKAFISRCTDRFRPAYGRTTIDFPRRCVFAASTNESAYLRDPTGARRFWPVHVHAVHLARIREHRDQLWAEAVHRFKAGEQWHPDAALAAAATAEQDRRYEADEWESAISGFLDTRREATVREIAEDVLGLDLAKLGQAEQKRIVRVLQRLGWKTNGNPHYRSLKGKRCRVRVYHPKDAPALSLVHSEG